MRALVQRCREAWVRSEGVEVGRIDAGLCVLVGVTHTDNAATSAKMADKLWNLRIFDDDDGVMNLSVADTSQSLLLVSQFTLYGDARKGRRPSYIDAARPEHAEPLFTAPLFDVPLFAAPLFAEPLFAAPLFGSPLFSAPLFAAPLFEGVPHVPSIHVLPLKQSSLVVHESSSPEHADKRSVEPRTIIILKNIFTPLFSTSSTVAQSE